MEPSLQPWQFYVLIFVGEAESARIMRDLLLGIKSKWLLFDFLLIMKISNNHISYQEHGLRGMTELPWRLSFAWIDHEVAAINELADVVADV